MKVFLSWSGGQSRAVAEALRWWLPLLINAVEPWLSSADIGKGARWLTDVGAELQAADCGILCVTPENLVSPWILFEAGALSKQLNSAFVCPYLFGVEPSDVSGPLAQFQATRCTKVDTLELARTINSALLSGSLTDGHLIESFEMWWPKLEGKLRAIASEDVPKPMYERSDRELLQELVELFRAQARRLGPPKPKPLERVAGRQIGCGMISAVLDEAIALNKLNLVAHENSYDFSGRIVVTLYDPTTGDSYKLEIPAEVCDHALYTWTVENISRLLTPVPRKIDC